MSEIISLKLDELLNDINQLAFSDLCETESYLGKELNQILTNNQQKNKLIRVPKSILLRVIQKRPRNDISCENNLFAFIFVDKPKPEEFTIFLDLLDFSLLNKDYIALLENQAEKNPKIKISQLNNIVLNGKKTQLLISQMEEKQILTSQRISNDVLDQNNLIKLEVEKKINEVNNLINNIDNKMINNKTSQISYVDTIKNDIDSKLSQIITDHNNDIRERELLTQKLDSFKNQMEILNKKPSKEETEDITNRKIESILSQLFPIHAIFVARHNENPNKIIGFGKWVSIRDKYLLCADDYDNGIYQNGKCSNGEGGDNHIIIQKNNLPSTNLKFNAKTSTDGKHKHVGETTQVTPHKHKLIQSFGGAVFCPKLPLESSVDKNGIPLSSINAVPSICQSSQPNTEEEGKHIHILLTSEAKDHSHEVHGETEQLGKNEPIVIQPKYFKVCVWERIE